MPGHLGKLKNLQVLSSFYVSKGMEFGIQQLSELNLHGPLSIYELQNVVNPLDASAANLGSKRQLVKKLKLVWSSDDHEDSRNEREVLEKLQPYQKLEKLSNCGYGGTWLPNWVGDSSFFDMVSLKLENCENCFRLPSLGLFPSLKKLSIRRLDQIMVVGAEFYRTNSSSSSTVPFASLEILKFEDMKIREEWECNFESGAFPRLRELRIMNCPKLKWNLPEQHACLSKLEIEGCPNASFPMKTFSLDLFPKLEQLLLKGCSNLKRISQEHAHQNLTELMIKECPKFESMPECLHDLLPSLESLNIIDCPELESFPKGGLPSNLKRLYLCKCSKMIAALKAALGPNNSLDALSIEEVEVESFPDEGVQLPFSLQTLYIWNCPNLEKLDGKGLCHLSSLKELYLICCPRLECLLEEGLSC